MAKGFFTQGVCLLTTGQTHVDDIKSHLADEGFPTVKESPAQGDWQFGGHTLIIPFLPEVNGYVAVDAVDHPWPDSMGDPQADPMTFGAWTMGQFGPLAFPGSLERAQQHSVAWDAGRTLPATHQGFIRLRISYVFGGGRESKILPEDYDPVAELTFLTRMALCLLNAKGVMCYFNPNGEVLRDQPTFAELWNGCGKEAKIPLQLWSNTRFYKLDETWGFMDTVGNGQLDIPDAEAVFPLARYSPGEVDYYLRNVTHYLFDVGRDLETGESIDGPGENQLSWSIETAEEGMLQPPRRIVRLYPTADEELVRKTLARLKQSRT